jgi:hypothetical protein
MSIQTKRTTIYYRALEGVLAVSSFFFIFLIIVLSIFYPITLSLVLILYNLFWTFKFGIYCLHTIYTHIQTNRWQKANWVDLFSQLREANNEKEKYNIIKTFLNNMINLYPNKIDFEEKIRLELKTLHKIYNQGYSEHIKKIQKNDLEVSTNGVKTINLSKI